MLNVRQNTSRIVTKLFRRFGLLQKPLSVEAETSEQFRDYLASVLTNIEQLSEALYRQEPFSSIGGHAIHCFLAQAHVCSFTSLVPSPLLATILLVKNVVWHL